MRNSLNVKLAAWAMIATLPVTAQAPPLSVPQAKGIYRDGAGGGGGNSGGGTAPSKPRAAVKFDVLLSQDGDWVPVSARYEFHSGDKFKFRMQSNQDGYIYLLNRTFNGDPEALANKGIERVRSEDSSRRPDGPTYRLLYPLQSDGNKVTAERAVVLPGGDSFSMDTRPGVEKLYLVVSSKPLKLTDYFNVQSGEIRRPGGGTSAGGHRDNDEDVLGQLNKELATYANNGQAAILEQKGIIRDRDSESYGVVRDSGKPAQFEVSLRHLPR